MDNVTLALCVSIAIVLVLLYNRKKSSSKKKPKHMPVVHDVPRDNSRESRLKDLNGYDDYNQVVQYMALEPDVYESHAQYTSDMGRGTTGASMMSERDDPNDVVPWVSFFKPRYRDVYSGEGSRQESSEDPSQMRENNHYIL